MQNYYGVDISEDKLATFCNRDPNLGTDADSIKKSVNKIGFKVKIIKVDFMAVWFDCSTKYIKKWEDVILRQIIAIYK